MSKKNRLMVYEKLVFNDRNNRRPGLDQDDGSLIAEFGDGKVDINFADMKKADLQSMAKEAGLEFDSKATKDDLVVLLENKSDADKLEAEK
jgi:hypothetical protein